MQMDPNWEKFVSATGILQESILQVQLLSSILFGKQLVENIGKYKSYPRIVGETGGKDFVLVHPEADNATL